MSIVIFGLQKLDEYRLFLRTARVIPLPFESMMFRRLIRQETCGDPGPEMAANPLQQGLHRGRRIGNLVR